MTSTDPSDGLYPGHVRLTLYKGCLVILSPAEYQNGRRRGKIAKRAAQHARRTSAVTARRRRSGRERNA